MPYFTVELQKSEKSIWKCLLENVGFYQLCRCLSVHPWFCSRGCISRRLNISVYFHSFVSSHFQNLHYSLFSTDLPFVCCCVEPCLSWLPRLNENVLALGQRLSNAHFQPQG